MPLYDRPHRACLLKNRTNLVGIFYHLGVKLAFPEAVVQITVAENQNRPSVPAWDSPISRRMPTG